MQPARIEMEACGSAHHRARTFQSIGHLAAAPVSQVDFQGDGSKSTGANLGVPTTGGTVVYPTTLVVNGAVTFQ